MTLVTAKWSLEDYHRMIDTGLLDERQVELIDGEILEMAPEGAGHSYNGRELGKYLRLQLGDLVEVSESYPITLPNNSEPQPDVAILKPPAANYSTRHPYPEDIYWLIEISNTTLARDLGMKKELYASAGIVEYWVVDLRNGVLVVFRDLTADGYGSESRYESGTISPLAFSDVALDIEKLVVVSR
jgi:Uma2 family endonuclease